MVDINIGNIVTIGIISIAAFAAVKFAMNKADITPSWM